MRMFLICLLISPGWALAGDLRDGMLGSWSGAGTIQLQPDRKGSSADCRAAFSLTPGLWMWGDLQCGSGRSKDSVGLRFSEPSQSGKMIMEMVNAKGKTLVTFDGALDGTVATFFHPETIEFSGNEYRPVLRFGLGEEGALSLMQLGIPTRGGGVQYRMSDFILRRDDN